MADIFGIRKIIEKYDEKKPIIELLRAILHEDSKGKKSLSTGFPNGLHENTLHLLKSYGFKAHNITVKDPHNKDAKTTLIQW